MGRLKPSLRSDDEIDGRLSFSPAPTYFGTCPRMLAKDGAKQLTDTGTGILLTFRPARFPSLLHRYLPLLALRLQVLPVLPSQNPNHLRLTDAELLGKLRHRDAVVPITSQRTPSVSAPDRQDLLVGQSSHAVQFAVRGRAHRWYPLRASCLGGEFAGYM